MFLEMKKEKGLRIEITTPLKDPSVCMFRFRNSTEMRLEVSTLLSGHMR